LTSRNLELVRSICVAWEHGDFSSLDWAHPEIEYVVVDGPEPGTWTGLSEMVEAHRDWMTAWDGFRVEAEEYRALDGERVLVLLRRTGRGKTSGLEIDQMRTQGASVFHVRDGKVTRLVFLVDRSRGLDDLDVDQKGAAADPRD
jgi:ketosteroid isomerase-like protein